MTGRSIAARRSVAARCALGSAVLVALASLAAAPAAGSDLDSGEASSWVYAIRGGMLVPAGAEGAGLDNGIQYGGSLDYELSEATTLGADISHHTSSDALETRILRYGLHARLSPSQDLTALFVEFGLGAYGVSYRGGGPALPRPPSVTRFGGSMGIGVDFATVGKISFGAIATYHGIVMSSTDALSFATLGISVTLRPGAL